MARKKTYNTVMGGTTVDRAEVAAAVAAIDADCGNAFMPTDEDRRAMSMETEMDPSVDTAKLEAELKALTAELEADDDGEPADNH